MHVFPYSPRKGTKAAEMRNQIDGNIKEKRTKELIEMSMRHQLEYNKKYCGEKVEVLIEEKEEEVYKGHTSNYILVKIENTEDDLENKIKNVEIEKAEKEYLIGKIKNIK